MGSSGSGGNIKAGEPNFAESTTAVLGGRPSELDQDFNGLAVFEAGPRRDDQFANSTVSGVLGRGWNSDQHPDPGAGVIGVGAPNRGPGIVGLGGGVRIASTFLGSPGNIGETGLGGTGLVGFGGPGQSDPDGPGTSASLPGAGVVGQGGTSFFETPTDQSGPGVGNGPGVVGIAGGRSRPPDANLSQMDLAATANVGVVGFGGEGPKPLEPGLSIGPVSAGAGVRGIGGFGGSLAGSAPSGPGVVGVAGDVTPIPPDTDFSDFGVVGVSSAPMREARRWSIQRNPRQPAYCETGRPISGEHLV